MSIRRLLIAGIFCSFLVAGLMVSFAQADGDKVNINTATVEELNNLKGIGDTKAGAILKHREQHGSFSKIDDLKDVSGVGDATFDGIKDKITVGKETPEEM